MYVVGKKNTINNNNLRNNKQFANFVLMITLRRCVLISDYSILRSGWTAKPQRYQRAQSTAFLASDVVETETMTSLQTDATVQIACRYFDTNIYLYQALI